MIDVLSILFVKRISNEYDTISSMMSTKPLLEPMLTTFYDDVWRHQGVMSRGQTGRIT